MNGMNGHLEGTLPQPQESGEKSHQSYLMAGCTLGGLKVPQLVTAMASTLTTSERSLGFCRSFKLKMSGWTGCYGEVSNARRIQ